MDSLGRLLLRFLLVPLGYLVAVLAGALVILFGSWKLGQSAADPERAGPRSSVSCSRRRSWW